MTTLTCPRFAGNPSQTPSGTSGPVDRRLGESRRLPGAVDRARIERRKTQAVLRSGLRPQAELLHQLLEDERHTGAVFELENHRRFENVDACSAAAELRTVGQRDVQPFIERQADRTGLRPAPARHPMRGHLAHRPQPPQQEAALKPAAVPLVCDVLLEPGQRIELDHRATLREHAGAPQLALEEGLRPLVISTDSVLASTERSTPVVDVVLRAVEVNSRGAVFVAEAA